MFCQSLPLCSSITVISSNLFSSSVILGRAEAGESDQAAPKPSEVEVGGVRVVALGNESSVGQSAVLRTAAGYEEASNFLKQSLYGGRQKRIPGSHSCCRIERSERERERERSAVVFILRACSIM